MHGIDQLRHVKSRKGGTGNHVEHLFGENATIPRNLDHSFWIVQHFHLIVTLPHDYVIYSFGYPFACLYVSDTLHADCCTGCLRSREQKGRTHIV